jgi:hypothetical protein
MSVLKDLRALSRRGASEDEIEEFERQVRLESNDRGAALLVATNTDAALIQAIYRMLLASEHIKDSMEKPGGPLENFSQRIVMGRAIGLYGEDTEHNSTSSGRLEMPSRIPMRRLLFKPRRSRRRSTCFARFRSSLPIRWARTRNPYRRSRGPNFTTSAKS